MLYHQKHLSATLNLLATLNRELAPRRQVLVLNNPSLDAALKRLLATASRSIEVCLHDNSGMEFGAYQAGLDKLSETAATEWTLIFNDTAATHSNLSRVTRRKLVDELGQLRQHPTIVGRSDSLRRSFRVNGLRIHRWMQSHIFALNEAALKALGGRVHHPEVDGLVTDSADPQHFFVEGFDAVLEEHLSTWLFATKPGPHWYAAQSLDRSNATKFAGKARSILQEKYLSALIENAGAEFADLRDIPVQQKVMRKMEDLWFAARRAAFP